jgi:hypothetical protein
MAAARSKSFELKSISKADRKKTVKEFKENWLTDFRTNIKSNCSRNLKLFIGDHCEFNLNNWSTYESTVFLTQRDFFTERIGLNRDGSEKVCPDCNLLVKGCPIHVLLECPKWTAERRKLQQIGLCTPTDLQLIFCNENNGKIFASTCKSIFTALKQNQALTN